ncbi:hypothetical protein NPIL_301511 [Nephila pilipes]|uniref:Uncharacterized protein n=1 Tax=Nephila pilipes TaxID=299642 RepID=A0A8X6PBD2_NEPPI|nr:hypothetical protein NPIL_301511 [Nephila pilipes]
MALKPVCSNQRSRMAPPHSSELHISQNAEKSYRWIPCSVFMRKIIGSIRLSKAMTLMGMKRYVRPGIYSSRAEAYIPKDQNKATRVNETIDRVIGMVDPLITRCAYHLDKIINLENV